MATIGIFFGSDTGNTENVAKIIQKTLGGSNIAKIYDIAKSNKEDIEKFNILLFGIPTWYYGEAQCDWEDFFSTLKTINFHNKKVAIFGCGDQEDYAEYFCDAMGILKNIIEPNGATIIGHYSRQGYYFEESKGLVDENYFVGLPIDEDRQHELTEGRIKNWVQQISQELNLQKSLTSE
ncbi:flavodoxin FldA [Arsenophonus symbiont of Ornithomya chloropus]|uniref:flavodoxin FldA n=1 Tax=Arsenophonus symbiont of Ornithomya chloropus TaxID=634121 RepID=UPI0032B2095F